MKLKKIMLAKTALLLLIITSSWCSQVPDQDQERYNNETGELETATQETSDYESDSEDNQDQAVPTQKKEKKYSQSPPSKELRTYNAEQRVPDYKD